MDLELELAAFKVVIEQMRSEGFCLMSMVFVKPSTAHPHAIDTAMVNGQTIEMNEQVQRGVLAELAEREGPESVTRIAYPVNPID